MSTNYRVLVVDDDKNLRESLRCALEREGYEVFTAQDGFAALEIMRDSGDIGIAVADIGMPRMDGIELLRRMRASADAPPLIFLTSRDEEFDRVLGLELGADDYLTKPFSIRELIARIKAILRRYRHDAAPEAERAGAIVRQGGLYMDADRFSAAWESRELGLTLTEFRLLASLAASPGIVKTREALLADAYPEDRYYSDRAVDCHIKRLRRKLTEAQAPDSLIETVYGLGYRYCCGGKAAE